MFFTELKLNASDILDLEEVDISAYMELGFQIQLKRIKPELMTLRKSLENKEKNIEQVNFHETFFYKI